MYLNKELAEITLKVMYLDEITLPGGILTYMFKLKMKADTSKEKRKVLTASFMESDREHVAVLRWSLKGCSPE